MSLAWFRLLFTFLFIIFVEIRINVSVVCLCVNDSFSMFHTKNVMGHLPSFCWFISIL